MKYDAAIRQAEKTGRLQEDCEDIAAYMVRFGITATEAEERLVKEGVLQ